MRKYNAILLVGPTGAGKTPLGDRLERSGLWGQRCLHFDFGANLRQAATGGGAPEVLTDRDREIVRASLAAGTLLEDEHFAIVEKILQGFAEARGAGDDDLLVLNGMPRHVGQAKDMDRIVNLRAIVVLECSAEVVGERIRSNAGGDRADRTDDSPNAVAAKLRLFRERTLPLLDHYRAKGVRIESVSVGAGTTSDEIVVLLDQRRPDARKRR